MDLLNLTLGELLAIFLPLSGIVVALYFYDRSRRRQVVSTLQFWPRGPAPVRTTRRRKLQQPLSLLLQLLAMLLLVLAIADLRFGGVEQPPRHHVVILETSAWMNAANNGPGGATLMEVARRHALAYLEAIPPADPVLLIRADDVPTPVTSFTTDREELKRAVEQSFPASTAANLGGALELARSSLQLAVSSQAPNQDPGSSLSASGRVGEVTYIGTGRIVEASRASNRAPGIPYLRFIPLGEKVRDAGIRRFTARREPNNPTRWEVAVQLYNYSSRPQQMQVDFFFEGRPLGNRTINLVAEASHDVRFSMQTGQSGVLAALLAPDDDFSGNNRASIQLPAFAPHSIEVYSSQPARWRTLLTSTPYIQPRFRRPSDYQPVSDAGRLQVFDRFLPDELPAASTIFIDPPQNQSPLRVARAVRNSRITGWAASHALAAGLNNRDVLLRRASVFQLRPGDVAIAECSEGPVIVARSENGQKSVLFGFHPLESGLENRLVTPLLFANTLRWFVPEIFRTAEVQAGSPGVVELDVAEQEEKDIQIASPENPALPWSVAAGRLRFYAGRPGTVRVRTTGQEARFMLTLPEVGPVRWQAPEGSLRGIPPPAALPSGQRTERWPWLAVVALLLLATDWRLFGRLTPTAAGTERLSPLRPLSVLRASREKGEAEVPERQVMS